MNANEAGGARSDETNKSVDLLNFLLLLKVAEQNSRPGKTTGRLATGLAKSAAEVNALFEAIKDRIKTPPPDQAPEPPTALTDQIRTPHP